MKTKRLFYFVVLGLCFPLLFTSCGGDENDDLPPGKAVSKLAFTDSDTDEGYIGGTLTWVLPNPESNIDRYVIYSGSSATDKNVLLGKVDKGSTSFEISHIVHAPYLLVVASNAAGESNNIAALAVEDLTFDPGPMPVPMAGAYILNSGDEGKNNSSLDYIDLRNTADKAIENDVFLARNQRKLGDLAQDMIVYGSKIYINVSVSKTIEVIDFEGKSIKQVQTEGQPRFLTSSGGKVYATLFNGYVIRLDTASLAIDGNVQVGRNPEQIVVSGNKLYVANSGGMDYDKPIGYDNTVSVIDIPTFKETKKIEVAHNPINLVTDSQGDVYLTSMENYTSPPVFQRINANTDEVTVIKGVHVSEMVSTGSKILFFYGGFDAQWNPLPIVYGSYDAIKEELIPGSFLQAGDEPKSTPYKIFADNETENIYITTSDYISNGDVYAYFSGAFVQKWETGLNPIKVVFARRP